MKRFFLIIAVAGFVTSCMPKLYPPQAEVPGRYIYAGQFSQDSMRWDVPWWELFGDTTLNRLVDRALMNNRDLLAAVSRVEEARLNLSVARAQFLPSVGLGVSAEGDYTAATKIEQDYAIEPALSWEISLFGALRNTTRAARAAVRSSEWAMRGVELSLTAQVATTYFTLLQYERDLSIARRSYVLRRESAALIDSMFRYGMTDGVALEQARSLVYTAQADIPLYERAVAQAQLSLNTLLGDLPTPPERSVQGLNLLSDTRPAQIPIGLPSDLLYRRPDVMEAYFTMQQAAAEAGVARSARFPSITLTAKGGIASTSISGLTAAKPWAWDAAASLTQPLFAFGKLKRREQAAVESYNQSVYSYEQSLLQAFADVESALASITTYREQTRRYAQLVMANDRIATMTQALYKSGMSDYLDVIDAERSLYQSQMQYVNLVAQQYINYVDLFKALGGGW